MPKDTNYTLEPVGGNPQDGIDDGDSVVDEILQSEQGEPDGGEPDGGQPDDAGQPDGGQPDGGEPDGGEPDGGQPDGDQPKSDTDGMSLKDILGEGYEDVEKVKTLIQRAEQFTPEVENELENLRSLRDDYEKKTQDFQPYKNPAYYKLDKLEEEDPENLPVYRSILFGNPDPLELVKLQAIAENPDVFGEDEEALELFLQDRYPELYGEEAEEDSQEFKRGMTRLKVDANAAKRKFQEKIDSIEVPDPKKETEDLKEKREKIAGQWQNPFGELRKEFSKIPVTVYEKDGKTPMELTSIEVDSKEVEPVLKQAAQFIVKGMLEPNKENVEAVKNFILSQWIQKNQTRYNTAIAEHVAKSNDSNWRKAVHNPKTSKQTKPKDEGEGVSAEDGLIEQLKKDGEIFPQV